MNKDNKNHDDHSSHCSDHHCTHSEQVPYVNPQKNVGRNDPCPCGSGKKFKKCCVC